MSTQVSESFIKQFEAEVHLCYQQNGSKLRNTVRYKNGVKGSSTVFQKVGKGIASQKARHGLVPVMSLDHSPVECELQDYYAGDWVDALDELKLSIDERRVIANSGAYALGRKTDELIIGALSQAGSASAMLHTAAVSVNIVTSSGFLRVNTATSSISGFCLIAHSTPRPRFPYPKIPILILIFFLLCTLYFVTYYNLHVLFFKFLFLIFCIFFKTRDCV